MPTPRAIAHREAIQRIIFSVLLPRRSQLDTLSSLSDKASGSSGPAKDPRSAVGRAGPALGEVAYPVGRLVTDLLGFFPQLVTRLVDPFPFAPDRRQQCRDCRAGDE